MHERFQEHHDHHPELTLTWMPEEDGPPEANPEAGPAVVAVQASPGHLAVVQARTQLGVRETGGEDGGVPLQRYVRYFRPTSGPLPWCAFFVSWCFDTTGNRDHRIPWENPGYVGSVHAWARARSKLVTTPAHGDMFGIGTEHMGFVAGADTRAGRIWTVEGNASDAVIQRGLPTGSLWFARM